MREVGRMIRTLIIHAMDGGPAFVTNWRNYERRSLDRGGTIARNLIGEAAFGIDGLGRKILERFLEEGLITGPADIFSLEKTADILEVY